MDRITRHIRGLTAAAIFALAPACAHAATLLGADLDTLIREADVIVFGVVAGSDTHADDASGAPVTEVVLDQVTAFKGQVTSERTVRFSYPGAPDVDGSPQVDGMPTLTVGNGVYAFLEESPDGLQAIGGPLGLFIDSFADTTAILTARDLSGVRVLRHAPELNGGAEPDVYNAEAFEYYLSHPAPPASRPAVESLQRPGLCVVARLCPSLELRDACRTLRDRLLTTGAGRKFARVYYRMHAP